MPTVIAADPARANARELCSARRLSREAWFCDVNDRELHVRSEWSDLVWSPPDAELDHVLVPHDGET